MTARSLVRARRRQSPARSRPVSDRHRRWWLAVFACLTSLAPLPSGIAAQETGAPPTALRSLRHLAVGNVSFLNTFRPTLEGGYLFQLSLRRNGWKQDEFDAWEVLPPQAYAHVLLAGGWSFGSESDEGGFAGLGQLGVIWRLDQEWPLGVNAIGAAVQASVGPRSLGPVARAELLHGNLGLTVGYAWFEDDERARGITVGIDLLRCILQDLGLVESCVI